RPQDIFLIEEDVLIEFLACIHSLPSHPERSEGSRFFASLKMTKFRLHLPRKRQRTRVVLLCNRVHDRVKGWAWTHRSCRLFLIGMIIPAHIDRFSLAAAQLGRNLGLIVCELFGNFCKMRLKLLIFD